LGIHHFSDFFQLSSVSIRFVSPAFSANGHCQNLDVGFPSQTSKVSSTSIWDFIWVYAGEHHAGFCMSKTLISDFVRKEVLLPVCF